MIVAESYPPNEGWFDSSESLTFEQGVDMDREMAELYARRATIHYNKGNYERAIDDFNQAIERQPTNANLYHERGTAYHKTGDYDRSI